MSYRYYLLCAVLCLNIQYISIFLNHIKIIHIICPLILLSFVYIIKYWHKYIPLYQILLNLIYENVIYNLEKKYEMFTHKLY